MRTLAFTPLVWCVALAATLALCGPAHAAAVSLQDARYAPSFLHYVHAHHCLRLTRHERVALTDDVSAYRWDGSALPAQRRVHGGYAWGRVSYRRGVFCDPTRVAVIVAGWWA